MKTLLILLAIVFSLNTSAQITFSTKYCTSVDTDSVTEPFNTNIIVSTNNIIIQTQQDTYIFDIFDPEVLRLESGLLVTSYAVIHNNIARVIISTKIGERVVMILNKDMSYLLFF